MKLRTAFFCKNCDREVDIEKDRQVYISYTKFKCPHCGYCSNWGLAAVYEWKVEIPQSEIDKANEILDALACKKALEEKINL